MNGSVVSEGKFVLLEGESVPKSADIVFLVEAKYCNRDLRQRRNIDSLIENIELEFSAMNLKNNRYGNEVCLQAVVIYL